MTKELTEEYTRKRAPIRARLREFKSVWGLSDEEVFAELCFCICTPQSRAVYCDKAIRSLVASGKLYEGSLEDVRRGLKAVRFPNNKSRYIVEAREKFSYAGKICLKKKLDTSDIMKARDFLVREVKGLGYKEASHFLRNIGFGAKLAILDVHILRNMLKYGVIEDLPGALSRKKYLELERKVAVFADRIGIPMDELDMLIWSMQTGEIFK